MNCHILTIDIPKNESVFQNELVLFFGHIENKMGHGCSLPKHVSISPFSQGNDLQVDVHPKTGQFHCVIQLRHGSNTITFKYCCTTSNITVIFQERVSNFTVLPLYIVCRGHNGNFQAPNCENHSIESARQRITLGCKLLQAIFALKMNGGKTFVLDKRGCVIFNSRLQTKQVYQMCKLNLWQSCAREVIQSNIGNGPHTKYIAFLSCTKYNGGYNIGGKTPHDDLIAVTDGYIAYGGEAFALLGTACLYTWPESLSEIHTRFQNETMVDTMKFLDDSCFRGTLGGCYATSLGAALHELCHTFDLGHDVQGIMGCGFNNIQQVFLNSAPSKPEVTDAFWTPNQLTLLNFHKWFNNYSNGDGNKRYILQYDIATKVVKSTAGIRLIELRKGSDELVIAYWVFDSRVLKYTHQINYKTSDANSNVLLVIQDNNGNILKKTFL